MQTIIGAPANGLQNYHLYGKNGKEMSIKDGGFSQVDLLQDVDAYNISRLYNLADTRLYAAFEDYYNVSKHYKRRYHIFKQQLLKEFDEDSIYEVAFRYLPDKNIFILSSGYLVRHLVNSMKSL